MKEKEQSQLINLASDLKAHVIGQDDAVDKIAKAIRRNRVGLGSPNRPIGSFPLSDQPVSGRPNCLNNWRLNSLVLQTI